MSELNRDDRLDQMLRELGPADPPVDLRRRVMTRIGALPGHTSARSHVLFNRRRNMTITRKAMWGLAAAAAIVLAVFAVTGFPPVGHGIEGTIGAAKKYQAPQMGTADVLLGDAAAQEFLQSDVFDRLVKDPEARALLSHAEILASLADRAIADALADSQYREALSSKELARLFTDAATRATLEAAVQVNATAAVRQASADIAASVSAQAAVAHARANQQFARVLDNQVLTRALLHSNLYMHLIKVNMVSALHNDALGRAAVARGFTSALATRQMALALAPR